VSDYSSMNDDRLEEIAGGHDVWSIGPALVELHRRTPERALPVARKLLAGDDEWLRSTALEVIFHGDRPLALDFMGSHVATCSIPVLRTMVELLTVDDQKPDRAAVGPLLAQVRDRLCSTTEATLDHARDLFFAEHPELRPR
jgi:hypothetical protein